MRVTDAGSYLVLSDDMAAAPNRFAASSRIAGCWQAASDRLRSAQILMEIGHAFR
jgi:hypothetical protein